MKISHGFKDNGVVVGNVFDKYSSRNPVVRHIMRGFDNALADLVIQASPSDIHELGCGEGYWVLEWAKQGISVRGTDFSAKVIDLARNNAIDAQLDPDIFAVKSLYEVAPEHDSADLIVCSEVLEHLTDPVEGLSAIRRVAARHVILTVPREPIWRALNMARGAYLKHWGNTPGHLQHWSRQQFVALVEQYFDVIDIRTPIPWTLLLCRVKQTG